METKSKKKKESEEEDFENFSISRGIDFTKVSAVINYDIPPSKEEYIHRIGRTARSNQIGIAITLLSNFKREEVEESEKEPKIENGEEEIKERKKKMKHTNLVWLSILRYLEENKIEMTEYNLDLENIESFRYRIVGIESEMKSKIKSVQLLSISNEIKNSNKIKNKWDSKKTLQHDFLKKSNDELLPSYLTPKNEQINEKLKNAGLLKNIKKRRIENEKEELKEEFEKKKKKGDIWDIY